MTYSNPIFITCFLKGAIPSSIIRDVKNKYLKPIAITKFSGDEDKLRKRHLHLRKLFIKQIDSLLDSRKIGPHFLKYADISTALDEAIQNCASFSFNIITYKVLSNHFHMLVDFPPPNSNNEVHQVDQILRQIKLETARKINHKLKRIGPIWEEENFNLDVDNEVMLKKIKKYINENTNLRGTEPIEAAIPLFKSKTIRTKNKTTSIYSEFRPGIVS